MPRFRRMAGGVLAAAAFWAVSCRDIPAPDNGIQSISALLLGSPGLVAGDTLRDSLGLTEPLRVIAFGLDNQPLDPQPTAAFIVLDTGAFLADGRFLIGQTPGTTVRVVGEVGSLQTQPTSVRVTLSPDALVATDSTTHHARYAIATDTVAQATLNTRVLHVSTSDTSGVEAVIVRYAIVEAPAGTGTIPTAVLLNGSVLSDRDTTDNTGRASRTARLRLRQLVTWVQDTVVVNASASYRGASIGTIQFLLIFTNTTPPAAGSGKP